MKDKWAQRFQEKMDGYEMAAPEMEWADIDKALAKNRRPHMGLIWGRRIAVAAAVAERDCPPAGPLRPKRGAGRA